MRTSTVIAVGAVGLVLIAGIGALVLHNFQERERRIPIGRTTTFVMGPVFADGYVDFIGAINEEFSRGVTEENNAAVVLLKALGTADVSSDPVVVRRWVAGFSKEMPAEDGRCAIALQPFADESEKAGGSATAETKDARWERFYDMQHRCSVAAWKAKDEPVVAAWLARNEEALHWAELASRRERFYVPLLDGGGAGVTMDIKTPQLGRLRLIGDLVAVRAMKHLGEGDIEGWRADMLTEQRLGRLFMQGQTLMQRLIGTAVVSEANALVYGVAGKLSAAEAQETLRALRELPAPPTLVEAWDKTERLEPLSELSALARFGNAWAESGHSGTGVPPTREMLGHGVEPVNFASLMRDANALCDLQMKAWRSRTYPELQAALDVCDEKATKMRHDAEEAMSGPGRAGMMLATLNGASLTAISGEHEAELRRQFSELVLLLEIYRVSHGDYPASLSALPAADVARADEDFFSGGQIIYRREGRGYVVYSVGRNGKDDGGVQDLRDGGPRQSDDIAVHVGG